MMMEKIRKILKSKGGFTLVELLVVIVVLGILAGVGVQQFGAVQDRANENVDLANRRILTGAAQMYMFAENAPSLSVTWNTGDWGDLNNYLEDWPTNPTGDGSYSITVTDGSISIGP